VNLCQPPGQARPVYFDQELALNDRPEHIDQFDVFPLILYRV
jgi:hypothetical protein